jgi:hypothetical protein
MGRDDSCSPVQSRDQWRRGRRPGRTGGTWPADPSSHPWQPGGSLASSETASDLRTCVSTGLGRSPGVAGVEAGLWSAAWQRGMGRGAARRLRRPVFAGGGVARRAVLGGVAGRHSGTEGAMRAISGAAAGRDDGGGLVLERRSWRCVALGSVARGGSRARARADRSRIRSRRRPGELLEASLESVLEAAARESASSPVLETAAREPARSPRLENCARWRA